ncbi:VanZ family protein [Gorillibacterium sp. CAU 1737]|uniref:VanZ family protein n=1 Tax=Gorillibacterium sp. CAU 1737 TaxID=3140362 RepID=UPI003261495C
MIRNAYFQKPMVNIAIVMATLLYAGIMISLLFFLDRPVLSEYSYNLTPFETINQYIVNRDYFSTRTWVKNLFGNIVLFIPIGICLPLLNRANFRFVRFLLIALTILVLIEGTQLITRLGSFDVDDLLLNAFGACIGYGVIRIFIKSVFKRKPF